MTRHHSAKRLVAAVLLAGGAGIAGLASQAPVIVDTAVIEKIRAEGLERSQVAAHFAMLVDVIGPRLTGSPAYTRAADWSRDTLAKWGLSNPRLETFEFGRGWTLEKLTIEMVEPRYMPLLGYAEAWSPSTKGELVVPVVSLAGRTGDALQAALSAINGSAVMLQPILTNFITTDRQPPLSVDPPPAPAPAPAARTAGPGAVTGAAPAAAAGARQGGAGRGRQGGAPTNAQLTEGGATVLLKPSRGMHGTVFVQAATRENPADPLPKIVLAGEHYNMIARLLAQQVPVKLRVNVQARLHEDRNSYNVLAELPGSDAALRDQIVMLGAHLDSWHIGTGATDNADGVAVAMEAFRILKAIGVAPRRTVRLALWGGEEEGLLGSSAYVTQHLAGDANRSAREKLNVYFNIDPGKGPIYGWYLERNDAAQPIFDAWLAPFKDLGAVRNLPQGIGNTDHLSFIRAGVPGFNPIQDYTDYDVREHHTNADLAERIKEQDLRQNAVILASFLYHAAMRTEMLPSPARK
jgi:carboxypeptidase Q